MGAHFSKHGPLLCLHTLLQPEREGREMAAMRTAVRLHALQQRKEATQAAVFLLPCSTPTLPRPRLALLFPAMVTPDRGGARWSTAQVKLRCTEKCE